MGTEILRFVTDPSRSNCQKQLQRANSEIKKKSDFKRECFWNSKASGRAISYTNWPMKKLVCITSVISPDVQVTWWVASQSLYARQHSGLQIALPLFPSAPDSGKLLLSLAFVSLKTFSKAQSGNTYCYCIWNKNCRLPPRFPALLPPLSQNQGAFTVHYLPLV